MIEEYTRVTEILSPLSGLDKVPLHLVKRAAERGTRIHTICEGIMLGLGEYDVDESIQGYIDSFNYWWETGKRIVEIEHRFFDDVHMVTGQVDVIIMTDDGMTIIDLKTSYKPSKTWPLQGSGYYYLARLGGYDIKKIQFLHLQKDGKPAKIYEYEADSKPFLDILHKFLKGEDYVSGTDSK